MIKGLVEKPKNRNQLEVRPMIQFLKEQNKIDLVGVEIGVHYGINAFAILNTLSIKKLYLVDPYMTYPEYLDIKNPFGYNAERHADNLLFPFTDKIIKIKKFSSEAVEEIPDNIDFVYIDGNHAYEYCYKDIMLYYPKIKKGGVIGGHDYYQMSPVREVKRAVDDYIKKTGSILYTEGIDWWIVKGE